MAAGQSAAAFRPEPETCMDNAWAVKLTCKSGVDRTRSLFNMRAATGSIPAICDSPCVCSGAYPFASGWQQCWEAAQGAAHICPFCPFCPFGPFLPLLPPLPPPPPLPLLRLPRLPLPTFSLRLSCPHPVLCPSPCPCSRFSLELLASDVSGKRSGPVICSVRARALVLFRPKVLLTVCQ